MSVFIKTSTGLVEAATVPGPHGLLWRGAWDALVAYAVRDAVTYNGSSYRRIVAGTTATAPSADTTNWVLVAAKGDTGATGATGSTGATGATGATGPGVPVGGAAGQFLKKNSGTDYDSAWATLGIKAINAQVGTAYTLALADGSVDKFLTLNNAAAITLTVPANATVAFPVGTLIEGAQLGAGQVTIVGAAGVTVNATPGLKVAAQYGTFGLLKTATDTWLAFGRLAA